MPIPLSKPIPIPFPIPIPIQYDTNTNTNINASTDTNTNTNTNTDTNPNTRSTHYQYQCQDHLNRPMRTQSHSSPNTYLGYLLSFVFPAFGFVYVWVCVFRGVFVLKPIGMCLVLFVSPFEIMGWLSISTFFRCARPMSFNSCPGDTRTGLYAFRLNSEGECPKD